MATPPAMDRALWRLAAVTTAGSFMSLLDISIVNVALATLEREFAVGLSQLQWVVTAYTLALAGVVPISGWAARRFGARSVYLASLLLFIVGSGLCGLAWTVESLVGFRVIQALGGAMLMPVGMMIMATEAGPQRLPRAMSVISIPLALAPTLGPVVGGLLVDGPGWRWVFLVNVPIGLAALALAWRRLPRLSRGPAPELDVLGLALLSIGFPALTYALAQVGEGTAVTAAQALLPLLVGATFIALFVVHALRRRGALLDVRLFANRIYRSAGVCASVLTAVLFGTVILLPLYLQQVRGLSALATGLLLVPQGVTTAIAPFCTARLVERFGSGRVVFAGTLVCAVGTIPLAFVGAESSLALLAVVLMIRGVGAGMATVPCFSAAYASVATAHIPDATTQMQLLVRVASALGTALCVAVLTAAMVGAEGAAAEAAAYGETFWWVFAATLLALVPAAALARNHRRPVDTAGARHAGAAPAEIP